MVAASKMRKAQSQMQNTRPYADKIRQVIGHLAHAHPEYKHSFMQERPVKRIGFIVISTDRGLCGGLNTNLFKKALNEMQKADEAGYGIDVCTIGSKSAGFFNRLGSNITAQTSHLGDSPNIESLIGTVKVMLDAYESGGVDKLFVLYNRFVNTMTQESKIEQLLPLQPSEDESLRHYWDYLYEPDAEVVLNNLLTRYIESQVYQGLVENIACEQASRMVAMKSASDNAGDLIDELELVYNKARQASITQELSEIVAGAAAV